MSDKKKKVPKKKQTQSIQKSSANIKNNNILTRFFSHNITLMVLSFILAFTIWFLISINSETDSSVTISNIPVSIELPEAAQEDGLEWFYSGELKASVEVSGNRVTVGSLSSDDISVYATQTSSIITSGTYTLPLNAKKSGIKNNYEIVSAVTPSSITIRVDKRKEVDLPIENRISVKGVDSDHYANVTLTPGSIHLSGPETQVNRIASAVVFDSITAESTVKKVKLLDSEGNELNFPLVTTSTDEVEVSVIVWPVKEVDLTLETEGAPDNCPQASIDPSTVKIAGPQNLLDKITDNQLPINSTPLDFTTLRNEKYTESVTLSAPEGCKIISVDNKSKEMKAEYTLDLSSYSYKTVSCKLTPRIDSSKYTASDYSITFDSSTISVEVYGPQSLLENISGTQMSAVADFTDYLNDVTGSDPLYVPAVSVKVSIVSDEYGECWVYGTYTASGSISKK